MDSFVLVAYASLTALRTFLQQLLAYLSFTLDSQDLFCWYKWKKWFLWTMAAAQGAENYGYEWGLMWYLGCIVGGTTSKIPKIESRGGEGTNILLEVGDNP